MINGTFPLLVDLTCFLESTSGDPTLSGAPLLLELLFITSPPPFCSFVPDLKGREREKNKSVKVTTVDLLSHFDPHQQSSK